MRRITQQELARMHSANESRMWDDCQILRYDSTGQDSYGHPVQRWLAGELTPCGYNSTEHTEVMQEGQVVIADGDMRLPFATELNRLDRIKLIARYGAPIMTPLVFDILGAPASGPHGLLVHLRLVTDGSST